MTNYKQIITNFGKKMALCTAQTVPLALLAGGLLYATAQKMNEPNPSYVGQVQTYQDSNNNGLYDTSLLETIEYFKDGTTVLRDARQVDLGFEVSKERIMRDFGTEVGLTKLVFN